MKITGKTISESPFPILTTTKTLLHNHDTTETHSDPQQTRTTTTHHYEMLASIKEQPSAATSLYRDGSRQTRPGPPSHRAQSPHHQSRMSRSSQYHCAFSSGHRTESSSATTSVNLHLHQPGSIRHQSRHDHHCRRLHRSLSDSSRRIAAFPLSAVHGAELTPVALLCDVGKTTRNKTF